MATGFRILQRSRAVAPERGERFRALPVANVSDVMARLAAGGARLRPMHAPRAALAGPALTVKTRPGDNLMIHKAIALAQPGDVIIVDAGVDLANALIGEQMVRRRPGGIVLNGTIRDSAAIRAQDFPVFATGTEFIHTPVPVQARSRTPPRRAISTWRAFILARSACSARTGRRCGRWRGSARSAGT
ncbi:hypothetical protein [Pseudoroseomonas cervicalis]|uniref:RraA family protein n=1 Tax=Teichococcus cervicalis TaxID=204525 RepID=UPI00277E3433|nr:hypothetical protein [Pseudoroseomonas cervicalis]MDQ1079098.1 regulator of RNase E activity RraA [Pseudoroseomonas cervicalis]